MTILVIVESGKKGKTIKSILGEGYYVWACGGHIRHMTTDGLGYDEVSFDIEYQIDDKKIDRLNQLKAAIHSNQITHTILASDPDREGEAIAASLFDVLELRGKSYQRSRFNEITKAAIEKSISEAEDIDYNLVSAQETRRIIDRAVGWKATAAVSQALNKTTPIGRVQSPAVSLVVERENAIKGFVPQKYFHLFAYILDDVSNTIQVKLDLKSAGLLDDNGVWTDSELANTLLHEIREGGAVFHCTDIIESEHRQKPPLPLTTLDMQKIAIQTLKLSGKEVDRLAQDLYQEGIITYPRTDSTRISDEGFNNIYQYGLSVGMPMSDVKSEYIVKDGMQDAHECIRPTSFNDEELSGLADLSEKHRQLYQLIKERTLISQMQPKIYKKKEYRLQTTVNGRIYIFSTCHNEVVDAGFSTYGKNIIDDNLSDEADNGDVGAVSLSRGSEYVASEIKLEEKKSKPPSRYTQSSLIKELDRKGIGRPSTFSTIFEKILEHGYVVEEGSNRSLHPTDFGFEMWSKVQGFSIMDLQYTKNMEEKLDKVVAIATSDNPYDKKTVVSELVGGLHNDIAQFKDRALKDSLTDHICLKEGCGGLLYYVYRKDKNGNPVKLYRCVKCHKWHFTGKDDQPVDPDARDKEWYKEDGSPLYPCPECESALCLRNGKYGEFWVCDSKKKQGEKCSYICNGNREKGPSYEKSKKNGECVPCPCCSNQMMVRQTQGGFDYARCYNCGYRSGVQREGSIIILSDNFEAYKKRYLIVDKASKFGFRPRVKCECGAVLKKYKNKDGEFIKCTGHLANDVIARCEASVPSVEQFDKLFT